MCSRSPVISLNIASPLDFDILGKLIFAVYAEKPFIAHLVSHICEGLHREFLAL